MHRWCTQVHENALRLWGLCIRVGIGILIATETDYDTDGDLEGFLDRSCEFSKRTAEVAGTNSSPAKGSLRSPRPLHSGFWVADHPRCSTTLRCLVFLARPMDAAEQQSRVRKQADV
jgi:hypothetical protein